MNLSIQRAYESPVKHGYRVLVDRIWPRGISKKSLQLDAWLKNLAPSSQLRQWFAHDPTKWDEFKRRYFEELDKQPDAVSKLLEMAEEGDLILVYATKEARYNNATALQEYLNTRSGSLGSRSSTRP
jgi:uncharacterized protein YeaO (DUF488 family)